MTTGKTIALTRRTLVGKVMSLLLNMLSRLVITFLPRSKRLLISWLQSPQDRHKSNVLMEQADKKRGITKTYSMSDGGKCRVWSWAGGCKLSLGGQGRWLLRKEPKEVISGLSALWEVFLASTQTRRRFLACSRSSEASVLGAEQVTPGVGGLPRWD